MAPMRERSPSNLLKTCHSRTLQWVVRPLPHSERGGAGSGEACTIVQCGTPAVRVAVLTAVTLLSSRRLRPAHGPQGLAPHYSTRATRLFTACVQRLVFKDTVALCLLIRTDFGGHLQKLPLRQIPSAQNSPAHLRGGNGSQGPPGCLVSRDIM